MPFEKRRPGEPVRHSATETNAFIEVALAHRARQTSVTTPDPTPLPWGMVYVKNSSGGARERFDVLALDAPLFATTAPGYKLAPAFDGITPDPENVPAHRSRIAILEGPLAAGKIGRAYIGGQLAMTVDLIDVKHTRARVLSNCKLQSGYFGPVRILGAASASSEYDLCRVDIDSHDGGHCFAKVPPGGITAGTYAAPSTTACTIAWASPTTGAPVDVTGTQKTINVMHYGEAIAAAVGYVQCRIINGRIVPDVAYC